MHGGLALARSDILKPHALDLSIQVIRARLKGAGHTLRRLPLPQDYMRQARTTGSWVTAARDFWIEYGQEKARYLPTRPTAKEIDELHEVLDWLMLLTEGERQFIGAWWSLCSFFKLAKAYHLSKTAAWDRVDRIAGAIALRLVKFS